MKIQTDFKKTSFVCVILLSVSILTLGLKNRQPLKRYTVSLTENQWSLYLSLIDSSQKLLVNSEYPSRQIASISTTIFLLNQEVLSQIEKQIDNDSAKIKK